MGKKNGKNKNGMKKRNNQATKTFDQQSERKAKKFEQTTFNQPQPTEQPDSTWDTEESSEISMHDIMNSIVLERKRTTGPHSKKSLSEAFDVNINTTFNKNKKDRLLITFRNSCLSRDIKYVTVGITPDKKKMFFVDAGLASQVKNAKVWKYKLSSPSKYGKNQNPAIKILPEEDVMEDYKKFIGRYKELHKFETGFYYIVLDERQDTVRWAKR